mmetsp:Transcript_23457/g.28382  ORF Transcript_23457/g.28382 Transcript_23457/m.28382 type:complete len:84 (+) Transcript_23457:214-465(+)
MWTLVAAAGTGSTCTEAAAEACRLLEAQEEAFATIITKAVIIKNCTRRITSPGLRCSAPGPYLLGPLMRRLGATMLLFGVLSP